MPFDIVLYEPEIPQNTGNIIRLCANTGAHLHLIRPLGFEWEDSRLKRAGLDYHALANVQLYDNYEHFQSEVAPTRLYACTTKAQRCYSDVPFQAGDALIFGPETRGLPDVLLQKFEPDHKLRIPMRPESRSLNLANAVSVMLYEAWRQIDFDGAR